jgi:DNA end-binding protein Ku
VPDVPRRTPGRPAERKMAEQLIRSMAIPFEPARYRSDYKRALNALIRAKRAGKELPKPAPEQKIVDLQEALRRSLEQAGGTRPRRRRAAA